MPSYSKGSEVAGLLDVGVGWGTSLTSRNPLIRPRGVPVYFGRQMYKLVEAQLLGKQAKYFELCRENNFPWHLRRSSRNHRIVITLNRFVLTSST
jgi:hypothetical protein